VTESALSAVLAGVDASLEATTTDGGTFLTARCPAPCARFAVSLGTPVGWRRAVALYRFEPFWMKPRVVRRVDEIPVDTQFLLVELESGALALVAPLVSAPFRVGLRGAKAALVAVADSGDPELLGEEALIAYVAVGENIEELITRGTAAVAKKLGTVRLRREDHPPSFIDEFGWCTWDAFYRDVSHDLVKTGLESFRRGGVEPRLLILDDGWLSTRKTRTGEERLTAFAANEKFAGGLRRTVSLAKREHRVTTFLVWHAVQGYWGGLDAEAFSALEVTTAARSQSPEILTHFPIGNWEHWGALVGRPAATTVARLYDEFHGALAAEGVDGVKVDNQATIEAVAHGAGGRVRYAAAVRDALETSVARHFDGRLINCMSCSTDLIYQTRRFGLTRTSIDFWPNDPSSHGLHAHTNALVSLWFGEFADPDWDMFQSGHPAGAFHAALRAVSGGPVYVSDKPGAHDFALLKKLVLSDGTILRAKHPGRPTRDCLFEDVLQAPVLLKIWNENEGTGVVGVFNACVREEKDPIVGFVSPADVPPLAGNDFAVWLHHEARVVRCARDGRVPLVLDTLGAEVATIAPIVDGFAPLGLADKLNGGGAIIAQRRNDGVHHVTLRDGGPFVAYAERAPSRVFVDGVSADFEHARGTLRCDIPGAGEHEVELEFDA